jgi:hypothetical protein
MMKTTLFLSTLAAGVLAVSTTTFAQSFGNYAQAYGDVAAAPSMTQRDTAPINRFTRSDLGYAGKMTVPRSKARSSRTPIGREPAPGQQQD